MTVSISATSCHIVDLETRIPFHFGNVEVTELPKVFLRVEANIDGQPQDGIAMGGLIPGWFYKDPEMDLEAGYRNMITAFRSAADIAQDLDPQHTAFGFWQSLYERQREWAANTDLPPLLWAYGVSLVEQALIDSVCRATDTTFADAVRENLLGIDLGSVYDELSSSDPADLLPAEPHHSIAIRHTIGLDDPLTSEDVDDRPADDLPLTLSEYVHEDGVNHFKIKLAADHDRDATRLARIATVLAELGVEEYHCTVDANEGYDSASEFRRHWEAHRSDPTITALFDRLEYVEQPLPRDEAFTPETKRVFSSWDDAPPIIIDESDNQIDSAGTALEYGYAGTSHKNCKGVFKGIINACLITHRNRAVDNPRFVISVEDLTTVGPIELHQDLDVAATIGADHVERNGHHYFAGLRPFPDDIQETALSAHDGLYRRHEDSFPTLEIEGGTIDLNSILESPFGVAPEYDVSQFTPLDSWLETLTSSPR